MGISTQPASKTSLIPWASAARNPYWSVSNYGKEAVYSGGLHWSLSRTGCAFTYRCLFDSTSTTRRAPARGRATLYRCDPGDETESPAGASREAAWHESAPSAI